MVDNINISMALTQILSPLANLVAFYDFIQPGDGAHTTLHVLCIWPIFFGEAIIGGPRWQ